MMLHILGNGEYEWFRSVLAPQNVACEVLIAERFDHRCPVYGVFYADLAIQDDQRLDSEARPGKNERHFSSRRSHWRQDLSLLTNGRGLNPSGSSLFQSSRPPWTSSCFLVYACRERKRSNHRWGALSAVGQFSPLQRLSCSRRREPFPWDSALPVCRLVRPFIIKRSGVRSGKLRRPPSELPWQLRIVEWCSSPATGLRVSLIWLRES